MKNPHQPLKLNPHPSNPRLITDRQRDMLKKSLEVFGDLSGIVVNRRTQLLVGGHQRVAVLEGLLDAEVQVVNRYNPASPQGTVLEGYIERAGERFTYREVDWDEETALAAMIAANQHGGEFDETLLAQLVLQHEENEQDPDLLGFEGPEIERLLALAEEDTVQNDSLAEQRETSDDLADTNFTLGQYRFTVAREGYLAWQEKLRQSVGFDNAAATEEIKKRLGL